MGCPGRRSIEDSPPNLNQPTPLAPRPAQRWRAIHLLPGFFVWTLPVGADDKGCPPAPCTQGLVAL